MTQENEKQALLIMDVQDGIVDRVDNQDEYLARVRAAVDSAHQRKITVIYVVIGFRPDFPEVSSRNKSFKAIKENGGTFALKAKPTIAPTAEDIVVTKHRVSAFSGSDLEVLLRAMEIKQLVLGGIATSGVVLSTLREAADKDFQLTVLNDLCADFDQEVHSVLIEKVFPKQATVMTSEKWIKTEESS